MKNLKALIASAIFDKSNEVVVILSVAGFFMALGFFLGDSSNSNYLAINSLASYHVWGLVFLFYSISKGLTTLYRIPRFICVGICTLGLWLWSYIFLSFVLFDPIPMTSTEILLLIPLLAEIIVLASTMRLRSE